MSIQMIVIALIGGGFALAANFVAFEMIDQINRKVPNQQKVDLFRWGSGIKKQHRNLYPDSKLASATNILTWLTLVCFLLLSWFVLR
jgi:hypothetical protein